MNFSTGKFIVCYPYASFTQNGAFLTQRYERAAEIYLDFAQTLEKVNKGISDVKNLSN